MLRQYLKSLADKFREKFELSEFEKLNAQDFPDLIDEVYEAGKQAGGGGSSDYSKFWDMVLDNGNRTVYAYAFSYWDFFDSEGNIVFNPKYDIVPTSATQIFAYIDAEIDLEAHLKSMGRKLDFSKCTMSRQGFFNSKFTRIGKCNFSKNPACNRTFEGCNKLVTIDEIELAESVNYDFTSMLKGCSKLKELRITGTIAKNNFNVADCVELSRDSLISYTETGIIDDSYTKVGIINALATLPSGTTLTITLGSTNLAKLSNEEKAIATQKGWTLLE